MEDFYFLCTFLGKNTKVIVHGFVKKRFSGRKWKSTILFCNSKYCNLIGQLQVSKSHTKPVITILRISHTLHTNCMTINPTCAVLIIDNAISNNVHTNVERTLMIHFMLICFVLESEKRKL